jgi:hypothetical protein
MPRRAKLVELSITVTRTQLLDKAAPLTDLDLLEAK